MSEKHDRTDADDIEIEASTEDVAADDSDIADSEEQIDSKLKKVKDSLKACEHEKREHLEELQRVKADFLNSKRRITAEADKRVDSIKTEVAESLLPLYDSFIAAQARMEEESEASARAWSEGFSQTFTQLNNTFRDLNVEMITETGVPFDPEIHEGIEQVERDDVAPDTVVEILQVGCIRTTADGGHTLIRPARVRVATS